MPEQVTEFTATIQNDLVAPFPEDEIEFLPRAATGERALALPHIDARSVMRRLDAVVGAGGWHFDFEALTPDCKKVKGKLTVLGVTKCDAGEASTEDEPLKSAVSDCLKRCGVHFGIARYLYCLPQIWANYDPSRRRFSETPRMPHGALERALAVCGWRGDANAPNGTQGTSGPSPRRQRDNPAPPVRDGEAEYAPTEMDRERERFYLLLPRARGTVANLPDVEGIGRIVLKHDGPPASVEDWTNLCSYLEFAMEEAAIGGSPVPEPKPVAAPPVSNGHACAESGCGKPLTKGQHDVSMRAFGAPLCPNHQRERARAA